MTLNQFKTLARAFTPGSKANNVKNPVLELIINQGAKDVAAYAIALKTNKKFNITAEQKEYNLSSVIGDFLVPDKPGLWWYNGSQWRQLHAKTLEEFDNKFPTWRDEPSGDPLDYSIDADILTLRPTPGTTLANGLWLYYGRSSVNMTAAGHYPFSGSTTEYTHLSVFDSAIEAWNEWKIKKILNKGLDDFRVGENNYIRTREEKFGLFKRRPDISSKAKLQGPRIV